MFSWIRGPSSPEPRENPYVEPPETPAPVFAARAIKHAIFGTPQPPETVKPIEKGPALRNNRVAALQAESSKPRPSNDSGNQDGPKLTGILSTPGASKERKTVSFGTQVVDNEGKKSNIENRSGLPNDYPGKFPSPWITKTDLMEGSQVRSSDKLKEALYDAKISKESQRTRPDNLATSIRGAPAPQPLKPMLRAKDDQDITIDIDQPRSDSGKYWKGQYESYSKRSEKEMNKLIKRQQLAKEFARKKDEERLDLATKLEAERKKHKERENELEDKNRKYKEKLRQSMTENSQLSVENATLKRHLAALEHGLKEAVEAEPMSDLDKDFECQMADLDPQQASLCKLDATPVSHRRSGKAMPMPPPPSNGGYRLQDVQSGQEQTQARNRAASASRKPRLSRHTKDPEPSDDPWVASDDLAFDRQEPPAKERAVGIEEIQPHRPGESSSGATTTSRSRAEISLRLMSNPSGTPRAEDARRKLALERVAQRKRERQRGKENVKDSVVEL